MNLQPINPPLREGQSLQCCKCLKMSHDVMADMDGTPFRAFYCAECGKHVCANCGHAESDHDHAHGPCNVKENGTHCICYRFRGAA